MAIVRIRYLIERKRRDGGCRYYWQPSEALKKRGWKTVSLGTDALAAQAEAQRLNAALDAWYGGEGAPAIGKEGSVDALITSYKRSRKYQNLAPKTRQSYDANLLILSRLIGDFPVRAIRRKQAAKIYDQLAYDQRRNNQLTRKGTPALAAAVIRVARLLFSFARDQEMISENPFTKPGITVRARQAAIWSPEQVRTFVQTADDHGFFSLGTAVLLNEWIGQRRGDVLALTERNYRDGALHITQSKTGAEVTPPVDDIPHLKARLAAQIDRNRRRAEHARQAKAGKVVCLHLIQTDTRTPYTMDGFASVFDRVRALCHDAQPGAGYDKLTFQGLRHTAVTRLGATPGMTVPMIAAITGHTIKSCETILNTYNIRTREAAANAFAARRSYEEGRT